MNRRTFIATAGASITALSAGASRVKQLPSATAASESRGIDSSVRSGFDRIVDIVDAGADNTGEEPITSVLEEHARTDDTLVYFPPGEYRMNRRFRFTGFENYGVVGDDAVIVPDTYYEFNDLNRNANMLFMLGTAADPGNGLLFSNLRFDQRGEHTGARVIQTEVETGLRVRNIDVRGFHDTGTHGPGLFHITDPDGYGVVERFRAPDGGEYADHAPGDIGDFHLGPTGIMMGTAHEGSLWFRDCELGGFPDNGLYDSIGPGRVVVEGGVYRNSNVANIRLGGDDSMVRDARIVVDERRPLGHNQRGIRLDHGDNLAVRDTEIVLEEPTGHAITLSGTSPAGPQTASIENTSIRIEDETANGIVVYNGAGATEIMDTEIEINSSGQAIQIGPGTRPTSGRVICDGARITGSAHGGSGREAIHCERDTTEFRNVEVRQTGSNLRQGLGIRADGCRVINCEFRTNHWSITNVGSETRVLDTTAESVRGSPAIRLYEGHEDVHIVNSDLKNGIRDDGGSGLHVYS